MDRHNDSLSQLDQNISLDARLKVIHQRVRERHPFIHRISVALYDEKASIIKTFLASSGRDYPLEYYESRLENALSLQEIIRTRQPRILNDLTLLSNGEREHTKNIVEQGYRASYTVPMYFRNETAGFIFFNSYENDVFAGPVLDDLDLFAHLISAIVENELTMIRSLVASLRAAMDNIQPRSAEQDAELVRISRYARIIAMELGKSGKYDLSDSDVEKIALLSPFAEAERIVGQQKQPVARVAEWIRAITNNLGLQSLEYVRIVENIARHYDPQNTPTQEIPIETRIVAVANMFDAMTHQGAYGQGWSNDEAFSMLRRLTRSALDQDCVEALTRNRDKVEQVQNSFMQSEAWIS
jgi:HD-GYP domain-containing protein (c-di-GMP phosphodiesterase class II)